MKNRFLIFAVVLSMQRIVGAQAQIPEPPPIAEPLVAFGWNAEKQSRFPTSLAASASGEIWVGTEDKGVWRYSPSAKKWTGFTTADGLGDDHIYAVAVDKLGRVWAGHLNHGVSVYNGEKWKNYTSLDGPLGDRVFAIATSPADGDVWIASECGLARYSLEKDDWDYFTRASGLPSNQVQAIAFDPDGNIVIGTQCDGIAMARKADEYRDWKVVRGPRRPVNAAFGEGLPSSQINSVFVEKDRSIDVATPWGIGSTNDQGASWFFLRGSDWEANTRGLVGSPEPSADQPDFKLMIEDWITAMGEHSGRIFAGTRQHGLEIRNAANGEPAGYGEWPSEVPSAWVRAFLFAPNRPPLVAVSDDKTGGLKTLDRLKAIDVVERAAAPKAAPPLPSQAKAPDAKTLQALTDYVGKLKRTMKPGEGYFIGEDWRTQGDWVGRYGRRYAKLFGMNSPADQEFSDDAKYNVKVEGGPHRAPGDGARYTYIQSLTTKDSSVLYNPAIGHRREAEVNDGSWAAKNYPFDWEGPDLFVKVTVPDGLHRISLYFHNNDAHKGKNSFRDYDLELWPTADASFYDEAALPLARARVTNFAGGVYKQFAVSGPGAFVIRVGRSRSSCTKLQGVFIDLLEGATGERKLLPAMEDVRYEPPPYPEKPDEKNPAWQLWRQLDALYGLSGAGAVEQPFRMLAFRAAAADENLAALLPNWRWHAWLWTAADRKEFNETMERAWKAYFLKHPEALEKPAAATE